HEKLLPIQGFQLKFTHAKARVATDHPGQRRPATGEARLRSTQSHQCNRAFAGGLPGRGAHPGGALQRIAGARSTAAEASRLAPANARRRVASAPAPGTRAASRSQWLAEATAPFARLLDRPGPTPPVQTAGNAPHRGA